MIILCVVVWLLLVVASLFLAAHVDGFLDLTGVFLCLFVAPVAFIALLFVEGREVVLWRRKP